MPRHFLEKLTRGCIYALIFLMPIFFLPISLDPLEVSKQTLLALISSLAALSWIGDMLMKRTLRLRLGWMNLSPIFLFLVVLVSASMSQGKYLSFLGAATQEYMSVLTMLSLVTLYYVALNTMQDVAAKRMIGACLLFSSALVAVVGAAALFGLALLPFGFAQTQTFNTIGTVNAFGVYLAAMSVFASGLWLVDARGREVLHTGRLGMFERLAIAVLCGVSLTVFIALDYWVIWSVLLFGFVILLSFVILRANDFKEANRFLLPFIMSTVAILFLLWIPSVLRVSVPAEVTPSFSLSWQIAKSALADTSPLFGTGPGTFSFSYAKYHSPDINQTAFWAVRFDRAASFALTVVTSVGVLGASAWVLFLLLTAGRTFAFLLKEKTRESWGFSLVLLSTLGSLVLGALLYSSNMTLVFFLVLLPALMLPVNQRAVFEASLKKSPRLGYLFSFLFTLASILFVFLIFVSTQRYLAEAAFAKAVRLERAGAQLDEVLPSLDRAATLVRFNDIYYRNLAQGLLQKLAEETASIDPGVALSAERSAYVQALTVASVNASIRSTDLSPNNVLNWLVRALVYRELIGLVGGSEAQALSAYARAAELEPNNPSTYTEIAKTYLIMAATIGPQAQSDDLGVSEAAQGEIEVYLARAEEALLRAIELKADYAPAHYQLAIVFEQQGRLGEAVVKMESVEKYNPLDVGVVFQLGMLYLRRAGEGDLDRARQAFEKAVYLAPSYSNARWFLASIYEQQGNFDAAIAQVEKVLELNPENDVVKTRLENLKSGKAAAELPPPLEEAPEPTPST